MTWRTSCSGSAGSWRANPGLRIALTNPFLSADAKRELLGQLLAGKVTPEAQRLIVQAADESARAQPGREPGGVRPAGGPPPGAAGRRGARGGRTDRSAAPPLAAALAVTYGHQVHLNVVLDPRVEGGMTVRVGDELIDGSVASRLAEARRRLAS